jgi:small GTP-binding protein
MTIGTTFALKNQEIRMPDGIEVSARIVLWDLAGQPTYNELRRRYMAGASMAIIVFDVTRPQTFLDIGEWYTKFVTVCPNAVVAVIANKIDRPDRLVPEEAGAMIKDWLDVLYFESSAKTGENVNHLFNQLITRAIQRHKSLGPLATLPEGESMRSLKTQ